MSTCFSNSSPVFKPAMRVISAMTNDNPMQVTTTIDHGYSSGIIVRILIPLANGMFQANGSTGEITVTGATTFTLPIDSSAFDVFAVPALPDPHDFTCAQVVPIGENNGMLSEATRNVI